ncbi:MAG: 3'-5' exonuclease [Clostridia bacterium]|nr:3'-5' exonuclease [Clostridia bacterium]
MVIYLDTETTGLYPGQICQLSYIIQTATEVRAKNFFFTVDGVEYGAYLVHGFSPEKLKVLSDGKRFSDFIDEIENDLTSADLIVSHNISFDLGFLREEFLRSGRVLYLKDTFCSMKNFVPVCKIERKSGGYKYPKLSELTSFFYITDLEINRATEKLFGVELNYHDARFDTTAVYLAMNCAIQETEAANPVKQALL